MSVTLGQIICSTKIEKSWSLPFSKPDNSDKITQIYLLAYDQDRERKEFSKNWDCRSKSVIGGGSVGVFSYLTGLVSNVFLPLGLTAVGIGFIVKYAGVKSASDYSSSPGRLMNFYNFWKDKPHLSGPDAFDDYLKNCQEKIKDLEIPSDKEVQELMEKHNHQINFYDAKLFLVSEKYNSLMSPRGSNYDPD